MEIKNRKSHSRCKRNKAAIAALNSDVLELRGRIKKL